MSTNDPRDKSTWTTFWTKLWRGESLDLSGRDALQYIESNTPPLRDVFQSAVEWTPCDSSVYISEMKYWIPTPWDNLGGRVTLAGDAAHPMLICTQNLLPLFSARRTDSSQIEGRVFSIPSRTSTTMWKH